MEASYTSESSAIPRKVIKVFIVDDDPKYRTTLEYLFRKEMDYQIYSFQTGEECFRHLNFIDPDVVVLDYRLNAANQSMNGFDILKKLHQTKPQTPVLFLSGQESLEVASNAIKNGAFDFIIKNERAFSRLKALTNKIMMRNRLLEMNKQKERQIRFITSVVILFILTPIVMNYLFPGITPLVIALMFIGSGSLFLINRTILNEERSSG